MCHGWVVNFEIPSVSGYRPARLRSIQLVATLCRLCVRSYFVPVRRQETRPKHAHTDAPFVAVKKGDELDVRLLLYRGCHQVQ